MYPEDRDLYAPRGQGSICTQSTGIGMHPEDRDLYAPKKTGSVLTQRTGIYSTWYIELVYTTQECEDLADCITVSHNRRLDI